MNEVEFKKYPNSPYELALPFEPSGDQPKAIEQLIDGINRNEKFQHCLG